MKTKPDARPREPKCPICNRPIEARGSNPEFPFCTRRCRMVDLGKWLREEYVIQESLVPPDLRVQ